MGQAPPDIRLLGRGSRLSFIDTSNSSRNFGDLVAHQDYALGAITDLRSIIWMSLMPGERCIRQIDLDRRNLRYWQAVYPADCQQSDLRRALVALRQFGPNEAGRRLNEQSVQEQMEGNPSEAARLSSVSILADKISRAQSRR